MCNRAFRRPEILGQASKAEYFDKWDALLEAYTAHNLRRESDKLAAVSGLAKKMQQVIRHFTGEYDVYLVGLWRSNLAQGLLWQRHVEFFHMEPARGRPKEWRAPSWSWASINGPVKQYHSMSLVSQIELIDHECVPLIGDVAGQIKSAWVILCGRLVSVNIERVPVADERRERDRLEGFCYRVRRLQGAAAYDFIPDEHAACFDSEQDHFCLHVANREERGFSQQLFIVLRRGAEDSTAFERIGVSDSEEAWDIIAYREKAGRLFAGAREETIKLL